MSLLKLIGVLMDYPCDALWCHRGELLSAAEDAALAEGDRSRLVKFASTLLDTDPMSAQDMWLRTFDRGRSMSLLLFEHIHGESRDRGQAMVDLIDTYRAGGLELDAKELPDYLPLVLEYLSQRPMEETKDWLHHINPILGLLAARALERQSPYAVLFELLLASASGEAADLSPLRQRVGREVRDDSTEAIDQLWEEEVVRFGADASVEPCPPSSQRPAGSVTLGQVQA